MLNCCAMPPGWQTSVMLLRKLKLTSGARPFRSVWCPLVGTPCSPGVNASAEKGEATRVNAAPAAMSASAPSSVARPRVLRQEARLMRDPPGCERAPGRTAGRRR